MSGDRDHGLAGGLTAEEAQVRAALRSVAPPRPTADFRVRLRDQFTSGAIERVVPVRVVPVAWHRRAATRWGAAALAAAAVLVAVSVFNQAPAWRVTAIHGAGTVSFDGVPVPTTNPVELARRVRPGVLVQVGDGVQFEVASAGVMAIEFNSGVQASVPQAPGRWFQRRAVAEVRGGEIRVMTGAGFRGAQFLVETPEARVAITGTTFAVICEPAGTCVCVFEGTLKVGARGGAMSDVTGGHRRFVFADGRPEEAAEMRPTEHVELERMRERLEAMMGTKK